MAIEIYNKPTIKYRVEGFSFFICNAWELMLKAHMINKFGEDSIYYKDNKDRTITLENCLQKVITNQGFAIKIEHLHFITKDRNQATSFVHVDKNAEAGVKIIKELKDPNYTHKYTMKTALKEINHRLQSEGIELEVN